VLLLVALGVPAWADGALPSGIDDALHSTATIAADAADGATALPGTEPVADLGEDAAEAPAVLTSDDQVQIEFLIHNLWICIAAFLVFIMHLGFATLETGLTQAKNTTNILFKNVMIICIGLITYALVGFWAMYPGDFNGFVSIPDWGLPSLTGDTASDVKGTDYNTSYPLWTDFLFQGMFAATAATIVSGCVAERIKLLPFLIFATIYVAFVYPILGSWHWGGGWLQNEDIVGEGNGFYDFAGSTLVHSVGGWAGLACILVLGPRKGKYVDGKVRPILPSNLPMATVGVFLLWFGWFGFNGGSVLSASAADVGYVVTTTSIAAALGGLTAGITSWVFGGKPDLTMALNGILAGLVGITAAPDTAMFMAVIVGILCGVVVYFSVLAFDSLKIDDPVGALSVHLVCGIIGTLFAGYGHSIVTQIIGIVAYGVAAFVSALVLALIIKAIFGWRVSEEEEVEGLDPHEHGMDAYHGLELK
jgi:Amt family ammonium transporter